MTQGLQLSFLLGNTDTALSGTATSDAVNSGADADSSAAFSKVLTEVSQAATSGQPKLMARKLPAAIGSLSDISKALLAATELKSEPAESDDALSANLLQQIAFSEQSQGPGKEPATVIADAALAAETADIAASLATEDEVGDGDADQATSHLTPNSSQLAAHKATSGTAENAALAGNITTAAGSATVVAAEPDQASAPAAVNTTQTSDDETSSAATTDSQRKTLAANAAAGLPVDDTLARSEGKAVLADAMAKQQAEPGSVASDKGTASKTLATPALLDTRIASQLRRELEPAKHTPETAETTEPNRFRYEADTALTDTALSKVEESTKSTVAQQTEPGAALRQWQGGHQTHADSAKLPVMPPETDSVQADATAQQTLLQETRLLSEMAQSEPDTSTKPAEGSTQQNSLTTTAKSTASISESNIQLAARDLNSSDALQANAATAPDDAVPVQATRTADSASQAKVGDERSGLISAADKNSTLKADTGSGKSGSEQSTSQQQQQPGQFAEPAANTLQHKVAESAGIERGLFNAESLTGRVDSVFGHSAQGGIGAVAAKAATSQVSVAEQLKQRLNLQHQDAAGQLRERVNLMLRQNIQVAEIRLDPVGLGQMQIKVDMQQDQAQVQFVVQQPQAKELLEQQMPRLREMLQQQGITLSEGNVQQQSQSQQQERQLAQQDSDGRSQNRQQAANADEHGTEQGSTVQLKVPVSDRMVDYYA